MSSSVRITLSASLTGDLLLSAMFLLCLQTIPKAFALITRTSSPLVLNMANGEIWQRQRGEMTTSQKSNLRTCGNGLHIQKEQHENVYLPKTSLFVQIGEDI